MTDVEENKPPEQAPAEDTVGELPASNGSDGVTKRPNGDVSLSVVSQQYDRGNKGYLDDTEKKVRALDKDNDGVLNINEVYEFMQNFEKTQQKAVTLKWVVIALTGFAVLLALANIGTSFAAATLAKDVTTSPDGALIDKNTGAALGASQQELVIDMDAGDWNGTDWNSTDYNATDIDDNGRFLVTVGVGGNKDNPKISQNKVDQIMTAFCPRDWPTVTKNSKNSGVYKYAGQTPNSKNNCRTFEKCGNSKNSVHIEACNSNRRIQLWPSPNGLRPECSDWTNKNSNNGHRPREMKFKFSTRNDNKQGNSNNEITFVCNGNKVEHCKVHGINCGNN